MDKSRRKELLEAYKQIKIYMGVYQIKNNVNSKILIGTCSNLKSCWFTIKMQLDMGKYAIAQLQNDWNELGEDVFTYEVLEEKEADADVKWELKKMEKVWLEKLQPYGDRGYNKPAKE
jgi:hypothetical protein